MNDSFLEDLELIPTGKVRNSSTDAAICHITTRAMTSSPLHPFLENNKMGSVLPQQKVTDVITKTSKISDTKETRIKESLVKDSKKLLKHDTLKQVIKTKIYDKKDKSVNNKLKSVDDKEEKSNIDIKIKQDAQTKISPCQIATKARNRRSSSYKENHSLDTSSKENSHPSDSSRESSSHVDIGKERRRIHESSTKKLESKDQDPVALLNAIKDIVSSYTKQESIKILKAMQELHINSQANLLKNLLVQTEDLVAEMFPNKDSTRIVALVKENEKLRDDIIILQTRNELLQEKLKDLESIKEENITLKRKFIEF